MCVMTIAKTRSSGGVHDWTGICWGERLRSRNGKVAVLGAVLYKRDRLPPGVARNGYLGENKNRIKIYSNSPRHHCCCGLF